MATYSIGHLNDFLSGGFVGKDPEETAVERAAPAPTSKARKKRRASPTKRGRTPRIYPALTFEESLVLAEAIHTHASGERVSRLTLLKAMNLSPTSSSTQILITSSGKYGITKGSFVAEHIELTETGRLASAKETPARDQAQARFELAIMGIAPFGIIYNKYRGKKLPSHDVIRDVLTDAQLSITDTKECIDTFVVNSKFVGLLQTIAGSETLVPLETLLEQLPRSTSMESPPAVDVIPGGATSRQGDKSTQTQVNWSKVCFYITPIGEDGTEHRKHSDLFLSSLIEPALISFGLDVIRADKIAQPGMITSQVLEHILKAKLVIADLSYHNPNVFYEMALRHANKLPVIQICRRADRLPFDVNQIRTLSIDTSDIYSLVPKLETYRSEIATQVRAALDGQGGSNPISVFFPGFAVTIPKSGLQ
jgi:hypothetical protein